MSMSKVEKKIVGGSIDYIMYLYKHFFWEEAFVDYTAPCVVFIVDQTIHWNKGDNFEQRPGQEENTYV